MTPGTRVRITRIFTHPLSGQPLDFTGCPAYVVDVVGQWAWLRLAHWGEGAVIEVPLSCLVAAPMTHAAEQAA